MLRIAEPAALADALHKLLGGMPDFFNGEPAVLDFAELDPATASIDWSGLLGLLRRFRLQPVGVRNLPAELAANLRPVGFAQLDDHELTPVAAPPQAAAPAAPPTPSVAAPSAGTKTLFVDRPVRSGQQIYARGGDIVLLAGMSNGAEVIADGSIHCYGPLRGRALAGAQGDREARIFASNFRPEIVSIAGIYKTFEQGIAAELAARPVCVRLRGEEHGARLDIVPLALD